MKFNVLATDREGYETTRISPYKAPDDCLTGTAALRNVAYQIIDDKHSKLNLCETDYFDQIVSMIVVTKTKHEIIYRYPTIFEKQEFLGFLKDRIEQIETEQAAGVE